MKIKCDLKTIEITKWESIKATRFDCEDRNMLSAAQEVYPDFKVVVEDVPFPDLKTGRGATYDFMECYILLVSSPRADGVIPAMEKFISMRLQGCSYFEIKRWFVEKFRFNTLWS